MIVVLSRFRAVSDGSGLARDKAGGMFVTVCVCGGGRERSMIVVVLSRFRAVSDGSGLARDKAGVAEVVETRPRLIGKVNDPDIDWKFSAAINKSMALIGRRLDCFTGGRFAP
ncbi:hypothetical protein RRG08_052316 [Elysia crispata]|uniref:Uncharacterized protein n=1 Tax=Elysia crispata TaxID=231223 RepID=A0AAE1AIW6_9GAST|nr:hypothetical protein RRG08_052316 [Elysia crispata]